MISKSVEILLVEDRDEDGELAIRGLNGHGLANHLVWVKDGEEALDFLFARGKYSDRYINQQPKLVLLDLKLPKINGIEVLREIRSNEKTRKIPVVILTTSSEQRDMIDAYDLGVNSYIVKPVDFSKFSRTVKEVGMYWLVINESPEHLK